MGVKFDNTYKLSSMALYLNLGHPSLPLNLKWILNMIVIYIVYCPMFLGVIYSTIFHDSFSKICTNLGIALLFFVISFNYAVLFFYKDSFNEMIRITEDDLEKSRKLRDEDEMVVKEYAAKGRWVSAFWLSAAGGTVGTFISRAILGTLYSAIVGKFKPVYIYDVTYFEYVETRKTEFLMYFIIFLFQAFYACFNVLMYVGFFPLGPILIMHACGQMELIIRKVKKLFSDETVTDEDAVLKLRDIISHMQHVYSYVEQIQQAHKAFYEMSIKATAVIMPFSFFGIIESFHEGSISIELITYVIACSFQCYIPCYYCEALSTKGEDLRQAVYGCGWERFWVPRSRSMILIILTRTAKPIGIRSVFSSVCLEMFTDCCNQAYSIFNVLNAAWY